MQKAHQKSQQLDKDDKLRNSLNAFWLESLVESDAFHMLMCMVIIIQQIIILTYTVNKSSVSSIQALQIFFMLVYAAEILLKWRSGFIKFWKGAWNILTFGTWILELIALASNSRKWCISHYSIGRCC